MNKIIPVSVLIAVVTLFFTWANSEEKIENDEPDYFIQLLDLIVVDESTGDKLTTNIKGSIGWGALHEEHGHIRMMWIGGKRFDRQITISSYGYKPVEVSNEMILTIHNGKIDRWNEGRTSIRPFIMRLSKIEPSDADNPVNPPEKSKNQLDD